jgi:SAM-dependent methyltransferase
VTTLGELRRRLSKVPRRVEGAVARFLVRRDPEIVEAALGASRTVPAELEPDDEAFLRSLYDRLLGRPIDLEGLAEFRRALANGMTRADVVLSLALSDEYRAKCRRSDALALDAPRAVRPASYRYEADQSMWSVHVDDEAGFDWLERAILDGGYYERGRVWTLTVDGDKRLMAEMIALLAVDRVLELGCASGAVLQCLHERGLSVEGVEISSFAIDHATDELRSQIHQGDLLSLSLPHDFDTVVGLDIFEHLNPNRLRAYLEALRSCLVDGGIIFANIPAYGEDEVFGEIFPYHLEGWEDDNAAGRSFRRLPADEEGYPLNGHLICADTTWWVAQFAAAGLFRRQAVESALQRKYGHHLAEHTPARRSFYVFSAGECPQEDELVTRIEAFQSNVLAEWSEAVAASR